MKSETDRRQTFEKWPVAFIGKNQLASAGFYYPNLSDIVCCAFCEAQVGHWEGDNPFDDHQRCRPYCGFLKGLFVRNIPIGSTDQPTTSSEKPARSRDLCGSDFELRPNSRP